VPKAVKRAGLDFGRYAGQSGANIVPPELARKLTTKTSLPQDEIFRQAVEGTPGASITDEGLRMMLQRGQKMEQEMAPSVRGGVFYLPEGAAQGKHYSKSTGTYGGSEKIKGETSIANPLFVKGSTGGKAPEQAYVNLMGKDAYLALQDDLMGAIGGYQVGRADRARRVQDFLSKYAPELSDYADYIVDSSKEGNQLRYALQEAAIGSAARRAGHDAIVGYSKKKTGEPFISEVFDVREVNYPSQNIEPEVWEQFTTPREYAKGGIVKGALQAIQKAAGEAGMKKPVVAEKELTTLQDTHTALGDRIRMEAELAKRQMEGFNKLIRKGSPASGPRPSFPGIEDKESAYLHMAMDPELRKHFNALMQQNTVTEAFNLPSGNDIRFAITEPALRDLETGVTGFSMGRMRPDIPSSELKLSEHPTYSHDIPGHFLGQSKYPIPYELSFPDTLKSVRENPKQAASEFGSLKMVGPRQTIDQQLIDELRMYEERMKQLTGKKKGGAVRKAAGGEITADDLILEERKL
jgi:hypothetical protein